jgi:autophagy-related protein 2
MLEMLINFRLEEVSSRIVVREGDITLFLYEGYDWATTRKVIEDEIKKMKQRLTRIKQLVASGQTYDPSIDTTNTLLFNSIHVGLDQDVDEMASDALIAAIDEQLGEDNDTVSVSSWQTLQPASSGRPNVPPKLHGRRLTRSRHPSIEFHLSGVFTETVQFAPNDEIVSRTFTTVKDVEILDHVKTSTWRKFLTALRSDSRGNIRETGSDMVRIELRGVHPVPGKALEETRLRVSLWIVAVESFKEVNFSRSKFYPFAFMLTKMHWTSSRSFSTL